MTYIPSEIFSFSFLKEHHLLLHLHQTKIKKIQQNFQNIGTFEIYAKTDLQMLQ